MTKLSRGVKNFFEIEIRNVYDNPRDHLSEPTLADALGSLQQAPDDIIVEWTGLIDWKKPTSHLAPQFEERIAERVRLEVENLINTSGEDCLLSSLLS